VRPLLPAAAALLAALVTPAVPGAHAALSPPGLRVAAIGASIETKQAEIDATRKRLDEKRAQLRFQQTRTEDLHRQISETSVAIDRVTATLDAIDAQLHQTQRRLAWNQLQLDAAETTLRRHNEALRRRLVDAYERGDLGYVNVLLSSTSFNDFAERWEDVRYLIAANQKTVRERRTAERDVARKERALEAQRIVLDDSLQAKKLARYQLASLVTQRTQLAVAAEAQRRSVAAEVTHLEELSAQQESELEAFIRQRQREEAARRAAEAEARRRAAQLAGQQVAPPVAEGTPGGLSWPVAGPITSPFGMRANPMGPGFEMHPGIDIGAPLGATITAAAAGRVIFAGWYGGYGNAVIIDHGADTSSLYGHCSQLFVSNGQDVQRGQAIGAVGSTGVSTGPHLHFEVRVGGVAVDPTGRLH